MATKSDSVYLADGSFDWSAGVDSSKVTTCKTELNPNGLDRNMLAWLNNATVRGGGITQRAGWQPLLRLAESGRWQGGFIYEPDGANPYLVCSISGRIYAVQLETPYGIRDLSAEFSLTNPPDAEMAWFVQGENWLVIQAGDFYTNPTPTLPLFWNGSNLRRSMGLNTPTPPIEPNKNEIPAATCMDYFGGRIWYAQGRQYSAGDIVGGPSGNAVNGYRDSILSVTENPLCFGGDGFTVPTNAGNIRALKHSANLNVSLGEGQLYIFTRKTIYSLQVPNSRKDWIAAGNNATGSNTDMPLQTVVQLVNGTPSDRSVVAVNGDLFYQSFDPAIRSLIAAVRYFQQWGNTPVSQNELRALSASDRSLMRFSSGIHFDNRLFQLVLPQLAGDAVNVIHKAVLPLDFDVVTSLTQQTPIPAWEGAYDGLQFLQVFDGDFGGLPRAFGVVVSDVDGSLNVWEMTLASKTENGDNRVTWAFETPAFNWSIHGLEIKLKQLKGGELWIDRLSGTVDFDVYYREDADPCWRRWFHTSLCAGRCEDSESATASYPCEPHREGYKYPIVFPEPKAACDSMGVRPSTIAYQFQIKVVIKGFCRVRGLILYALPHSEPQYHGIACPPSGYPEGMRRLPYGPPPASEPISPVLHPPSKAILPDPENGETGLLNTVTLGWQNGGGATSYNVYFNGAFIGNQTSNSLALGTLPELTTFEWRIDSVNADGTTTGDVWSFTTGHVPVPPEKATTPTPADGAIDVAFHPTLSWVNGGGATSYDVYFDGAFIGNQAGTTYDPGILALESTHTWRIDAVNADGTTAGDVWSFTVLASRFSFTPDTSTITWTDTNGTGQTGNLAAFQATADIDTVTDISLVGQSITALDYPSDLPALEILDCSTNAALAALDVTGCVNLVTLICNHTAIAALDLTDCTALVTLTCNNTSIAALDVSPCAATLFTLRCNDCASLATVTLTGCSSLNALYCSSNPALPALDASDCTALTRLECYSSTILAALNVSNCALLRYLFCYECALATLDVTDCVVMYQMLCYSNSLSDLDVTQCPELFHLICSTNALGTIDLSANPDLEYLSVDNCSLTALDVTNNPLINTLSLDNNPAIAGVDLSACTVMEKLICSQCAITALDVSPCVLLSECRCNFNLLNATNVSSVLCALDGNGVLTGIVDVRNNAVPTAGGITCANNLIGKGWSVNRDL